ncbi:EFR1 family ferrodoxin [Paenibacillus macerans]|uniref:EFR1 family ferrodoxin n=1 Tax=Paenibacillus macerans TaxID=44252 RepID=UPI003D31CE77
MIFYFTGTGNSLYAARAIASEQGEELISIAAALSGNRERHEYELRENETIGFVHPVYAWGPPPIVLEFIKKLELRNYRGNYVFSVVTCGGSAGNTMKVMADSLQKQGLRLNSGYSVVMPNNYIMMGDVDSEEVQQEKLRATDGTLRHINEAIGRKAEEFQVIKGRVPWLVTGIIHPMFVKGAMNTAKFHANDRCTGCGICAKVCNCGNIQVSETPAWGQRCTQCLACIHYCPVQAVQYGQATVKKGRYVNPNISIAEISKGKALR